MAQTIMSAPRPKRRKRAKTKRSPGKAKRPAANTPVARGRKNEEY